MTQWARRCRASLFRNLSAFLEGTIVYVNDDKVFQFSNTFKHYGFFTCMKRYYEKMRFIKIFELSIWVKSFLYCGTIPRSCHSHSCSVRDSAYEFNVFEIIIHIMCLLLNPFAVPMCAVAIDIDVSFTTAREEYVSSWCLFFFCVCVYLLFLREPPDRSFCESSNMEL